MIAFRTVERLIMITLILNVFALWSRQDKTCIYYGLFFRSFPVGLLPAHMTRELHWYLLLGKCFVSLQKHVLLVNLICIAT